MQWRTDLQKVFWNLGVFKRPRRRSALTRSLTWPTQTRRRTVNATPTKKSTTTCVRLRRSQVCLSARPTLRCTNDWAKALISRIRRNLARRPIISSRGRKKKRMIQATNIWYDSACENQRKLTIIPEVRVTYQFLRQENATGKRKPMVHYQNIYARLYLDW